ncbi:60S ribosomal protein L15 [Arthroderma uncinatum]|uniref:60S ribosomal protein L15 n=1 Tax=Arthroderma uncinatum TaxID=74035 RepID=UPI00144AC3F6|nr:60S ribosomal protein L15 [Arthroderma uncinatum]KAF3480662.1 60S ribosomal protein L15 [Arthroderma uncinatum]
MAGTKRLSVSTRDAAQTGSKKARQNLKQSATTPRAGRHGSVSDELESEYGISDGEDGSDDAQIELDDARNALKNLQAAIEKAEKSDTFAKEMEKKVRLDERRLRGIVKKEEEKWYVCVYHDLERQSKKEPLPDRNNDEEIFRSRFSSLIKAALSARTNKAETTSSFKQPLQIATSDVMLAAGDHPLYHKTQELLESSRALINGVDSISTHTSEAELPHNPKEGLEKDVAEARRIIAHGAEATAMAVEKLLVSERNGARRESQERLQAGEGQEAFQKDNNLQAMFEMGREELNESTEDLQAQGWGLVAHHLERGMREFVKALPQHVPRDAKTSILAYFDFLPTQKLKSQFEVVDLISSRLNDAHAPSLGIELAREADQVFLEQMGALKYVEELQKKKQSDVMRFLLRVRCWELRQLNVIHRASRPSRPDKARRLGYKAKQGYVIYRIRVRRGGRKRTARKGATYGKPTNQGINQLKYQRSLKSTAEERVGKRCANLRVLNSYWINQDSTYKYYEIILVDPQHKAIRNDARINWIVNPVHKHRESRGLTATGKKSRGLNKGHGYHKTTAGRRKTWKRLNTQNFWRYR